jgi:hypothetical protein
MQTARFGGPFCFEALMRCAFRRFEAAGFPHTRRHARALDPRIHEATNQLTPNRYHSPHSIVDCRVKPGNDVRRGYRGLLIHRRAERRGPSNGYARAHDTECVASAVEDMRMLATAMRQSKKMRWLHSRSQRKEACRESNQDQFDSGGMT